MPVKPFMKSNVVSSDTDYVGSSYDQDQSAFQIGSVASAHSLPK